MFSYMKQPPGFYRTVWILMLPIVIQNLVTSTLGMADTFMVGLLGELPMAAVTLANIPLTMVEFFIFGVQSGVTVLISQYWGRQDRESINRVLGVGVWLSAVVAFTVALILLLNPAGFLSLFGNDPVIVELAAEYGRIAGFSYALSAVTMVYVSMLRAIEKPQVGMYVLMTSMLCNTFLNWVLIFGNLGAPALGVRGAAIATLIARILEWVMLAFYTTRSSFRLSLSWILRPGMRILRQFIKYSTPVVLNEALWGIGTGLYPSILGHMENSQEILAAYTIAGNVNKIGMVAAIGIASTASILIGREIGAGRKDSVYKIGLAMNTLAALAGVGIGLILYLLAEVIAPIWIFPLFKLSEGASSVAQMMILVLGVVTPIRNFNTTNIVGVLRGGGDVFAATVIDLIPMWLLALPLAGLCGLVWHTGPFWVYIMGNGVEQAGKCLAGIWRLQSGKWIHDLTRSEI